METSPQQIKLDLEGAPVLLLRDEFRTAKRARTASGTSGAAPRRLVLANVRCWDAARHAFGGPSAVVIRGAQIQAVSDDSAAVVAAAAANGDPVIDGCG